MGVCYSYILGESQLFRRLNFSFLNVSRLAENSVKTTGMFNNLYVKLTDPEEKIFQGDATGKAERGWKMLIHDPRDSAVIDIRTHGSTLDAGWGKDIRIYLRQVHFL